MKIAQMKRHQQVIGWLMLCLSIAFVIYFLTEDVFTIYEMDNRRNYLIVALIGCVISTILIIKSYKEKEVRYDYPPDIEEEKSDHLVLEELKEKAVPRLSKISTIILFVPVIILAIAGYVTFYKNDTSNAAENIQSSDPLIGNWIEISDEKGDDVEPSKALKLRISAFEKYYLVEKLLDGIFRPYPSETNGKYDNRYLPSIYSLQYGVFSFKYDSKNGYLIDQSRAYFKSVPNFESSPLSHSNQMSRSNHLGYDTINIPEAKVPISRAYDVEPNWTNSEDIRGNHKLIRLYVGAIGKAPIKFFITDVDSVKRTVVGYDIVGSGKRYFNGYYTQNQNSYELKIHEKDQANNTTGVFQLSFICDNTSNLGFGTWVSDNGKSYKEVGLMDLIRAKFSRGQHNENKLFYPDGVD